VAPSIKAKWVPTAERTRVWTRQAFAWAAQRAKLVKIVQVFDDRRQMSDKKIVTDELLVGGASAAVADVVLQGAGLEILCKSRG
jgi:hypothetical protein